MSDSEEEKQAAFDPNMQASQASHLKKNDVVVLQNRPCKIIEMSSSKTGKHGHAKVKIAAIDIFTGKKYEDVMTSTHMIQVPIVNKTTYHVVEILEGEYLSLIDDNGNSREDLTATKEVR